MENEEIQKEPTEKLLNSFEESQSVPFFSMKLIVILIAVAIFGVGSGYLLSKNFAQTNIGGNVGISTNSSGTYDKGTVVGSNDTKTFKDMAEGVLKIGGIDGEGQYHLVRPGGDSQNVYLTSTIVDLSKFQDQKIKVWGETHTAKKAGWLMDVGRVEVLE
ncbi:MAG: hypothetical protein ABH816_00265 [Candidatus Levyibacteriota bacterium]